MATTYEALPPLPDDYWSAAVDVTLNLAVAPPSQVVEEVRSSQYAEFATVTSVLDNHEWTVVLGKSKPSAASSDELRVWWAMLLRAARRPPPGSPDLLRHVLLPVGVASVVLQPVGGTTRATYVSNTLRAAERRAALHAGLRRISRRTTRTATAALAATALALSLVTSIGGHGRGIVPSHTTRPGVAQHESQQGKRPPADPADSTATVDAPFNDDLDRTPGLQPDLNPRGPSLNAPRDNTGPGLAPAPDPSPLATSSRTTRHGTGPRYRTAQRPRKGQNRRRLPTRHRMRRDHREEADQPPLRRR